MSMTILVFVWIGWGFIVLGTRPAIASRGFGTEELLAIGSAVIAVLLGLIFAIGAWKRSRGAVAPLVAIAAIGSLLFLLPFLLWSQGSIPFYGTASLYAIALVAATLFAGSRYLQRFTIVEPVLSSEVSSQAAATTRRDRRGQLQRAGKLLLWAGLLLAVSAIISALFIGFVGVLEWLAAACVIIGGLLLVIGKRAG